MGSISKLIEKHTHTRKKTHTKTKMSAILRNPMRTLGRRLVQASQEIELQVISTKPAEFLEKVEKFKPTCQAIHSDTQIKLNQQTTSHETLRKEHVEIALQMQEMNKHMPFNIFK